MDLNIKLKKPTLDDKIKKRLIKFYKSQMQQACNCLYLPEAGNTVFEHMNAFGFQIKSPKELRRNLKAANPNIKFPDDFDEEFERINYLRNKDNAADIIVNHLFESKSEKCLFYDNNEFAKLLGITDSNEIFDFVKTCCKNNSFSPESINKFISEHEKIFIDSSIRDQYNLCLKWEEDEIVKYEIRIYNRQIFTKESKVRMFLSFILAISQREDICNPKQKLSVDDILALANNIKAPKDRYEFKRKALGYFLPEKPEDRRLNLNQIWPDIEKLFADKLKDENTDELTKFNIKFDVIHMLVTKKNLKRIVIHTPLTTNNLDFIVPILQFVASERNQLCEQIQFYKSKMYQLSKKNKTDDKKQILEKACSVLSDTTVINQIISFICKCECDYSDMDTNWQVFVILSFVLPKSSLVYVKTAETKFKLLDFYVAQYAKNKKTDELDDNNDLYLCDILFTDINEFIDQFYSYYIDKKEFGSEQYQCFLRGIAAHLTDHLLEKDLEKLHGKKKPDRLSYCVFGLDKAGNPVLKLKDKLTSLMIDNKSKSNSEMQLFLYKFMRYIYVIISDGSKNSFPNKIDICPGLKYEYLDRSVMIDFLDNTLSILNKNRNISKELKYEMIYSIATLFFSDVSKCSTFLCREEFINMVADMIQKPELNIYLDQYKKNFFSYIKEQLLEVKDNKDLKNHLSIYLENKNRDLEINRLQQDSKDENRIKRMQDLGQQWDNAVLEINDLRQTISFYKWLYLFAIVPVLGWVFCAILYFYFHKPCLNHLGQLRQDQETISRNLDQLQTTQDTISNRLNQLMQERTESREQSEQLKHDCQILLSFIDSKEQMPKEQIPPENIIIDNEQNKQNNNLLNAGARKPLSENDIITIENKF